MDLRDAITLAARAYHRGTDVATHHEIAAAISACAFLAQLDDSELDNLQEYINAKTKEARNDC